MSVYIYTAVYTALRPTPVATGAELPKSDLLTQLATYIPMFTNVWATVIVGQKAWSVIVITSALN